VNGFSLDLEVCKVGTDFRINSFFDAGIKCVGNFSLDQFKIVTDLEVADRVIFCPFTCTLILDQGFVVDVHMASFRDLSDQFVSDKVHGANNLIQILLLRNTVLHDFVRVVFGAVSSRKWASEALIDEHVHAELAGACSLGTTELTVDLDDVRTNDLLFGCGVDDSGATIQSNPAWVGLCETDHLEAVGFGLTARHWA